MRRNVIAFPLVDYIVNIPILTAFEFCYSGFCTLFTSIWRAVDHFLPCATLHSKPIGQMKQSTLTSPDSSGETLKRAVRLLVPLLAVVEA